MKYCANKFHFQVSLNLLLFFSIGEVPRAFLDWPDMLSLPWRPHLAISSIFIFLEHLTELEHLEHSLIGTRSDICPWYCWHNDHCSL